MFFSTSDDQSIYVQYINIYFSNCDHNAKYDAYVKVLYKYSFVKSAKWNRMLIYGRNWCVYIYITNILTESTENQPISLVFKPREYLNGDA